MNSDNKKKILIVGGCGYVGGYLTDLLSKSFDITVYDNLLYEDRFLKPVKFVYGDVLDRDSLGVLLSNNCYDVIIWLAAIVGDGACAINPDLAKMINTDSVKWICDNFGGKIIFPSTCSVYGANNELLTEESPTNPLSVYASTKLDAERYVMSNKKDCLVFRLGTLFGVGDSYSRIRFDLVVNNLTKKATRKEKLTVFGGNQWRPILHVKDVSNAMMYGIKYNIAGLYNLSMGNFTIKQIATSILDLVPGSGIEYTDMSFEDARNYMVSCEKFYQHGWLPSYNLECGISEIDSVVSHRRVKDTDNPLYYNAQYLGKK